MRQAGLTLVELMVALTLGLFLSIGLMYMMSDSSRTFKIQDDYARMQENAVSGLRYLSDTLRHVGFYGLAADTVTLAQYGTMPSITRDCGNALQSAVPLFGYDGVTTATVAATVPCVNALNFQPGPILIARLATGIAVPDPNNDGNFADGMVLQPSYANTLYVQSDVGSGYIFRGSDFAALAGDPTSAGAKRHIDGRQFLVFPYQMHVYYVRPCSRPTGVTSGVSTCQASDDGGRPIPTLVRQELEGTTMVERPLAEGIERISFSYGVDVSGDGIADRFVADPLTLSADGWTQVVSVRVTLLVRSPTLIAGHDDSGKDYDLDGDGDIDSRDFNCGASGSVPCMYRRAIFSQLIQVRNVAFRRGA